MDRDAVFAIHSFFFPYIFALTTYDILEFSHQVIYLTEAESDALNINRELQIFN